MVRQPLFSTYRAGENRVTSSILAVFQRIDLSLVERLLGEASGESSLGLMTFTNQLTSSAGPDPGGRTAAIDRCGRRGRAVRLPGVPADQCVRLPHDRRMAEVIRFLLAHSTRTEGHAYQVFLLSSPEDSATVTLPNPIVNTTKAASGRSWAWTLGQRYTSLASLLKHPATTTDLDAIDTG
jgi:hypothetical protein